MLDENSKQNICQNINTICRTAIMVLETLGNDVEYNLINCLTQTAEAIAAYYEMEPEVMEKFHSLINAAQKEANPSEENVRFNDVEQTKEMIYTFCDDLTDPKEIMNYVRTADEMMAVWESERKAQS